jgi:hypothetical protein
MLEMSFAPQLSSSPSNAILFDDRLCTVLDIHATPAELHSFTPTTSINSMLDQTEDQIAANELRAAAYHEAGHKALYQRFGGAGDVVVWKNQSGNPEEVAWLGQFRPRTCPEEMCDAAVRGGFAFPDVPPNWRRLFSMAGLVAEEIQNGETHPVAIADTLDFRVAMGEVSASDLAGMGVTDADNFAFTYYSDVEQCVQYLLEEWAALQDEAEYVIANAAEKQETVAFYA